MRLVCGVSVLICAGLLLAAPARAAKIDCPRTLLLESTNGSYYVTLFGSSTQMSASFDLTLYTKSAAYTLSVPAQALNKPAGVPHAAFRGAPVVVRNPSADPFLGVTVAPTVAYSSLRCDPQDVIVPSVDSLTAVDRHVDPQVAALEDQAASEVAKSGPPLTPVPAASPKPLACDTPFADASVAELDKPPFPDAARQAGVYGTVSVRVDLDETGAVTATRVTQSSGNPVLDDAAVASARRTIYHPARFACEAQKSTHDLDFDFSR